jgi:O-antigen ligase
MRTWSPEYPSRQNWLNQTNHPILFKTVVILTVVGGSALVGRFSDPWFFLGPVVILATLWSLNAPHWGILMGLVGAVTIAQGIETGTKSDVNISVIFVPALAAIWLFKGLLTRRLHLLSLPVNKPLLGFIMAATLSLVVGDVWRDFNVSNVKLEVQLAGWTIMVLSAVAFWLGANVISSRRILETIVNVFILFSFVVIVNAWLTQWFGIPFVFTVTNALFFLWPVALSLGQLFFNVKLPPLMRLLCLINASAWLAFSLLVTRANVSDWLPQLVVVAVLGFLRWRRWFLVLAVAAAIFFAYRGGVIIEGLLKDEASSFYRPLLWRNVIEVGMRSPILGLGPASYKPYTVTYYNAEGMPGWSEWINYGVSSHNNYIDIFAQTGVIGLFFFLWTLGSIGYLAFTLFRHAPIGFAQGYAAAMLGGWIAVLVSCGLADWLIPQVYNIGLNGFRVSFYAWLFWGAMGVLQRDPV